MGLKNIGILLMGGSSIRMDGICKQFYISEGDDKQLFIYPLLTMLKVVDEVVIVTTNESIDYVKGLVSQYNDKPIHVIGGGDSRTQSVSNALNFIKENNFDNVNVIIHDAARPFVPLTVIQEVVSLLNTHDAVSSVLAINDSLLKSDEKIEYICRNNVNRVQTPQGFKLSLLKSAYDSLNGESKTDDFQLVLDKTNSIALCQGSIMSFKVTNKDDLTLYNLIIKSIHENKN